MKIAAQGTACGSVLQPAGGVTPMDCDHRLNKQTRFALASGLTGAITLATSLMITPRGKNRRAEAD